MAADGKRLLFCTVLIWQAVVLSMVFAQLYGPYLALHRTALQERPPADFLLYCNVLSHWSSSVSRKASSVEPIHQDFNMSLCETEVGCSGARLVTRDLCSYFTTTTA